MSKSLAKIMSKSPFGWIHSCGSFSYQLDCPRPCKKCAKKGRWAWVEKNENGFYISYMTVEKDNVRN